MSATSAITGRPTAKNAIEEVIPDYLIRETISGIPFYYKGYRDVLTQAKTKTDIMADSGIQGFIKMFFVTLLARQLDLDTYHFFVGETDAHLDHRNNLSLDISIFEKTQLTPDKITNKYIDVPPKIVIEVDVNIESKEAGTDAFDDFVLRKIRKLHEFGTEKVVWIFSKSKTIIIATPDNKWSVVDWNETVKLMDGIRFNVADYLEKNGVSV